MAGAAVVKVAVIGGKSATMEVVRLDVPVGSHCLSNRYCDASSGCGSVVAVVTLATLDAQRAARGREELIPSA